MIYRYLRFYKYDTSNHRVDTVENGGICFCFTQLTESRCLVSYVIVERNKQFKKKNVRIVAANNANAGQGFILLGDLQKALSNFIDNVLHDGTYETFSIECLDRSILKSYIELCQSSYMQAEKERIFQDSILRGMRLGPRYKVLSE